MGGTNTVAIRLNSISGDVTVNFNGGTVDSMGSLVQDNAGSGDYTINVAGGTASGGLFFSSGDDDVNVNGGILVLDTSNFSTGDDTLNVNAGGTLHLGERSFGSDAVTIRLLEEFDINAGATLRMFVDSVTSPGVFALPEGSMSFASSGAAITLEIVLPSGYTLEDRAAFDLISITGTGETLTFTASQINVRLYTAGTNNSVTALEGFEAALTKSGQKMQVGWQVFRASSMNCSYTTSTTTVDCSGGVASNAEFTGGIKLSSIFISLQALSAFSSGTHAGNLTLNLGNLAATVNTAGTGHGIEIDGTVSRSRVTGSLTVNNQTNSSTLRDVQVRGADKAALYVKSAASVTVTNAASLVLVSGGNTRRGIRAEASSGTASVTNSGAIGLSCTSNCGTGHSAIYSRVASGTGANTVTNSGTLNMKTTAGTSSRGVIFDGGTPTFINTGNITADTHAVLLTSGVNGAATINFNGGTVTVDSMLVFSSSPNQSVTVNVGGGTATGRFSLTNEDDTVNVNNGGTLVLANGASVFGGGTDTLTVNSGGALHLGDATNGSVGVTMTGLDTFTINAGATLRFYENDGSSLNAFTVNTALTIGNAIIELYLPAGFSLADRAASTIIDAGSGSLTVSDATLTALASNLRIIRGGERYAATVTFTKSTVANEEKLQLAWTNLGVAPSSLSCSLSATTLSCTDGNATDYEFVNGMAMAAFFAKATGITGGSVSGNLTLSVNNLAATVNRQGTDHGFIADGTAASSDVGGNADGQSAGLVSDHP